MTKIVLRNVTASDLPILFEQQADPESSAMAAFSSRDRKAFDAHWAKIMADGSNVLMTIVFDGQVAGNIVSWEQDGAREIGYWLGREFWGKGIATQALMQLLEIETTRPLTAHVATNNIASRRVLEKCGFIIVGEDKYINPAGVEVGEVILKLETDGG